MKSCINWRKSFNYMDEVDEYNIDFKDKKEKLLNFLDTFATGKQRVNIYISQSITENEINIILAIWEMNKYNIAICIEPFPSEIIIEKIQTSKIPFYYISLINNWETLNAYIEKGVESVFIYGDLAFDLQKVKQFCKKHHVRIRCYPNICQYLWDNSEGIKTFFIRPEDVDYYDDYIDILEFWNSENIQNPLYETYFHDKKWAGDLREIIQGLKFRVNSYYILGNQFAKYRTNCKRDCIKGSDCNLCQSIIDFANTIENSDEYEVYERINRNG